MELYAMAAISSIFALVAGAVTVLIVMVLLAGRVKRKLRKAKPEAIGFAPTLDIRPNTGELAMLDSLPTAVERPMVVVDDHVPTGSVLISDDYDGKDDALLVRAPVQEPELAPTHTRAMDSLPLPMPVAPQGVEPIPELEPTEIMIHRPDWDDSWEYAIPR